MMELTTKQSRFVDEFLVDGNGSRAARAAGYSESTAGAIAYENLRKPEIVSAIETRMLELDMSRGRVLHEVARLALRDLPDESPLKARYLEMMAKHWSILKPEHIDQSQHLHIEQAELAELPDGLLASLMSEATWSWPSRAGGRRRRAPNSLSPSAPRPPGPARRVRSGGLRGMARRFRWLPGSPD